MIRFFIAKASILVATLPALLRNRREQAVIELALRQQLATYPGINLVLETQAEIEHSEDFRTR